MGAAFGEGYVMLHLNCPITLLNRAVLIEPHSAAAAMNFFRHNRIPPKFDVAPVLKHYEWERAMYENRMVKQDNAKMGSRIVAGHLAGVEKPSHDGIEIRPVEESEFEIFNDIMATGFAMPFLERPTAADWTRTALTSRGVSSYLAWCDGKPVACALFVAHEGVAYLGNMTTLEKYRGRGAQTALLARRLFDAAQMGCDVACALVAPESPSERNLRRAGLIEGYDREVWMPRDWREDPFYTKEAPAIAGVAD